MTKLRASYVCEKALSEYALSLDFSKYIRVGKRRRIEWGKFKRTILADTFEAFVGALYLDQGLMVVKDFIDKVVIPIIENDEIVFNDYKSLLQELVQTDHKKIEYKVINQSGPSHNRKFTVMVTIDGVNYGTGTGKSKKQAEQEAAKKDLDKVQ